MEKILSELNFVDKTEIDPNTGSNVPVAPTPVLKIDMGNNQVTAPNINSNSINILGWIR